MYSITNTLRVVKASKSTKYSNYVIYSKDEYGHLKNRNNGDSYTLLSNSSTTEEEEGDTSETEEPTAFNAENFLLEIYQTAEQGVAFLSSLLDLPNKLNATKPATDETTTVKIEEASPVQNTQRRAPKNLKHPNQL